MLFLLVFVLSILRVFFCFKSDAIRSAMACANASTAFAVVVGIWLFVLISVCIFYVVNFLMTRNCQSCVVMVGIV